jgi:hypothetical protein
MIVLRRVAWMGRDEIPFRDFAEDTSTEVEMTSSGKRAHMAVSATRCALVAALSIGLTGCDIWLWSVEHSDSDLLAGERPECVSHWQRFPLYFDPEQYDAARMELDREGKIPGLTLTDTRREFEYAIPTQAGTPSGPIGNVAGPITDIPEFHDCQKFVQRDVAEFDSLFAVFASFRLDSIVSELTWENVTWLSSNSAVATVNAMSGVVTAAAPGSVAITATSLSNGLFVRAITITVQPAPTGLSGASVSMSAPGFALGVGETITLVPLMGTKTQSTLAAAAVYSYGPGYPHLGIGPNFSCMYLYFDDDGDLTAKMVPVRQLSAYVHACLEAVDPLTADGTTLTVHRTQLGSPGDIPAVARWDYDPQNRRYYIGIKCNDAWCEISGNADGETFTSSPAYGGLVATTNENRPLRFKGWYDEQFVAVRDLQGTMRPGAFGTVIPDPALGTRDSAAFVGEWVPVAYIALQPIGGDTGAVASYKTKLNLDAVPVQMQLTSLNQIFLCFGTRGECQDVNETIVPTSKCPAQATMWRTYHRWWVKIVSAQLKDVRYTCVIRRGHDDFKEDIPGTARWRWILNDDTVWRECTQGCCEVETCVSGAC